MVIVLPGERPPSWNEFYTGKHWSSRKEIADRAHLLVRSAIDPDWSWPETPVVIDFLVYFDKQPQDSDNICDKIYIDGLIGWAFPDDKPEFVSWIRPIPLVDPENPRIEIHIRSDHA